MAFKWAIVGPGNIAKEFASDLSLVEGSEHVVHAIIGRNLESAGAFAKEHGAAHFYDSLESFFGGTKADAVYIATPHTLHHEETLSCLSQRLPVLCEKPLAINATQVQEMILHSEKFNTFLMEGMWIRFLPSITTLLELIRKGVIGEVLHLHADMSYRAPKDAGNRFFNPDLGGGSLLDLGIYPVFLSLLLFGRPDSIKATGKRSGTGVDETCSALLGYNSGQYAVAESSIVTQTPLEAVIFGSEGLIRIPKQWNEKPAFLEVENYNGQCERLPLAWEGRGFQFEVMEAMETIRSGKIRSGKMPHDFSLMLMETMDEIRRQLDVRYPAE